MKHYLTFKDDKSDKFWQIEVNGKSFTVTYGKSGSAGASQVKTFDSEAECSKAAEKLLAEKLRKGYAEGDTSATHGRAESESDHLSAWKNLVTAKERKAALQKHFSYLAETPRSKQLLTAIIEEVKDVACDSDKLKLTFGEFELEAAPPATSIQKTYPKSFQHILGRHKTITISKHDTSLGEHNMFNLEDGWFDHVDEEDEILKLFAKVKRHLCPISEGTNGNFWIYHPKEKNEFGEPTIYYLEHDGMVIENPQEGNAGDVFLNELAKLLMVTVETPSVGKSPKDPVEWWKALGETWQGIFERSYFQKMESGVSIEKIKKLKALDRVVIPRDAVLSDLDRLLLLPNLKEVRIYASNIKSYEAISALTQLKKLEIDAGVYSLQLLGSLVNMEELVLCGDHITSLQALSPLNKLKSMKVKSKNVDSIDVVANYSKLAVLNIADTNVSDISILGNVKTITHLDLPASVMTLMPLKDLKLWFLNSLACKISVDQMVDFISCRKDGFKLLKRDHFAKELLYKTFSGKLEGVEDKVFIWFSLWLKENIFDGQSIMVKLALCYFLEDGKCPPGRLKDVIAARESLEPKLTDVKEGDVDNLYSLLRSCIKDNRRSEGQALLKVLTKVVEKKPEFLVYGENGKRLTLREAMSKKYFS